MAENTPPVTPPDATAAALNTLLNEKKGSQPVPVKPEVLESAMNLAAQVGMAVDEKAEKPHST